MSNAVATTPQLQVGQNSSSQRRQHARVRSRQRVTPPPSPGRRALAFIPYEVGRRYRVPTVRGRIYNKTRDWPIMGPLHEDREFIGFEPLHYHIDWRFVSDRDLPFYGSMYAVVMQEKELNPQLAHVRPIMRTLLCKRAWPKYPRNAAKWLPGLEAKYADCVLKSAVCPHRGLPLDTCEPDENGVVTCPGHGLRWNVKTGRLVR